MDYRDNLAAVRELVRRHARAAGLSASRAGDLVLAASEVAANTLAHTAGGGRVWVWPQHGAVFCEFRDTGTFSDPQAGRSRPPDGIAGRLGLWVVRHVCDGIEIRNRPGGTTTRLFMSLADPASPS